MSNENKWRLHHGIHRGTITSRDADTAFFDTEEAAREWFKQQKAWYKSVGYSIWFANLHSPDGKKIILDHGVPYQR